LAVGKRRRQEAGAGGKIKSSRRQIVSGQLTMINWQKTKNQWLCHSEQKGWDVNEGEESAGG